MVNLQFSSEILIENLFYLEKPAKMTITADGVKGTPRDCDAKCIKHCAKEYTQDPAGFVQCMKDCGCIPPSEM
uniref:Uncharacterized protein n=1 Tax=Panagrolaimus sp. ES5 TaxID=591445 RepID=A0AC34FB46_9BILA